jgi:hypothetical protein
MVYLLGILLAVVLSFLWVKFVNRIFRKREPRSTEPLKQNEFIKWHQIKKQQGKEQEAMNKALQGLNVSTKQRRNREYPEYLKWCSENKVKPVFYDAKDLDSVIP